MNNSNNTEMKHRDNTSVLPTEAKTNLNLTTCAHFLKCFESL